MPKTKTTWKVVAPGIRHNSRSKEYEALGTFYIGSFKSIAAAKKAKAEFTEAVIAMRDKLRGTKPEKKRPASTKTAAKPRTKKPATSVSDAKAEAEEKDAKASA